MPSVRDVFFNEIYKMVCNGEDIYIVTADLGAPSLDSFRKDFPERYISVGIAEQSLISISAGLALGGKKVIAYGLNPFPVTRAYDQIRCLMAELNIPITVCALNAGLCSAECGYTHMPVEDVGMMRMLGNIKIYDPTDETLSKMLASETIVSKSPRFIRFDKSLGSKIYLKENIELSKGYIALKKEEHYKVGIITSGCFAKELNDIVMIDSSVQLINIFSFPNDKNGILNEIKKCDFILTLEENISSGGIGSYIAEIMADNMVFKPLKRMGLNFDNGYYDVFTNRDYIRNNMKISINDVCSVISGLKNGGV